MGDVLIITDTHFGVKNNSSFFLDYMQSFFLDTILPYMKEHHITTLWHLGDFFENRKQLGVQTLNVVTTILNEFELSGIKIYLIKGNHDIFYNNTDSISSIDPIFSKYPNVRIIDGFEEIDFFGKKIAFMNWITPAKREEAYQFLQETTALVVCGHLKINDFEVIKGVLCESGLDTTLFDKFDRVFSGHFHIKSTKGFISYLGNPYQTSWSEVDVEKGFHVYNVINNTLTFVENKKDNYVKLYYSQEKQYNFDDFRDKIVRVFLSRDNDHAAFENFISQLEKVCYTCELVNSDEVRSAQIDLSDFSTDVFDMMLKWIEKATVSVDKTLLTEKIVGVYKKAVECGDYDNT